MDLPDPKKTAPENWTYSCAITRHPVVALRGQEKFRNVYHATYMREGRKEASNKNPLRLEEALEGSLAGSPVQVACHLRKETKTGALLTVHPSTVSGTELDAQKLRDDLFLQYGLDTPDLPKFCDGCNSDFSICHALDCKKCVLVTVHHNEIRDGVADLDGKKLPQCTCATTPLIFPGHSVQRKKAQTAGSTHPPSKNKSEAT